MSKKLLFNLNKNVSQDYTYVKYTGTIVTATNTLEKPIKNAILKGDTKYRDVDTGEILDSFDGTKNLELVSVKMPVLQTYDGNIMRLSPPQHTTNNVTIEKINDVEFLFNQGGRHGMGGWKWSIPNREAFTLSFDYEKVSGCENQCQISVACAGGIADRTDLSEQFGQFEKTYHVNRTTPTAVEFKPVGELTSTKSVLKISNLKWYIGNKVYSDKTNILRTPEEVVLKGLGDVQDTLNINTGEMIERIGIAKLSQIPDEDFGNFAPYGVNSKLTKTANINIRKTKFNKYFLPYRANPKAISNFALCYDTTYNKDFECFALHSDDVQSVQISLSHSRFNDELTKEKMIQLIKELDITLVYELATPTIKTVDLSILDQDENTVTSISSFNDTTHVTTSSDTVPPIFEGYIATKESVE